MQQTYGIEKFLVNSLNRVNIQSNPIDYYMESGIMIKYLKRKYKDHLNHISESLGMTMKDINRCNFTKEQFRKLLNFYMSEKVQ